MQHRALEADVLPGQHPGATVGTELLVTKVEFVRAIDRHVLGQVEKSCRAQDMPAIHLVAGGRKIFVEFIFQVIRHNKSGWCRGPS